ITYTLPANSDGLRLDDKGAERYLTATERQSDYFAQDIVYLYNDNPYERAYKLQEGTGIDLGGGVKADITKDNYIGCVGYDVRLTWPTGGTYPANIQIPILGEDVDYKPARFDGAAPNHTNPARFESVTVSGQFSADTIEKDEIYLVVYEPNSAYVSGFSPILNTYKIDWDKAGGSITPASGDDPATLTLNLKASGAVETGAPAFSDMGETNVYENGSVIGTKPNTKRAWGIQVGYRPLFTSNAGSGVEYGSGGKATLAFNLHTAEVNYAAPPKYYMSIVRNSWNEYAMKIGATEAEVQGSGAYPITVLTFYNERGFFADDPANPAMVQISDEGAQKVSFNGAMFLETYGLGTLKFTKDSAGIHMEAENMRLQALNTPIFVPSYMFKESRTLMMHMYNGTRYSLNPAGSDKPVTFAPWGDISLEIAGWTGFAAGIDEIQVTKNMINVKGGLWMTWPFAQEPFGGFGVERLELEINNGQDHFAEFRGIEAEGGLTLPQLYIMGGSAYARINTFENDYYFETDASIGPASLGGFLHLKESERLGIWLPNSFYFDFDLGEAGVPLVPPAIVAWITGVSGGISNMVDTIDYDWRTTFFPPITFTVGAHFKLVQLLSFHAEITSGFYSMVGTLSGSVEIGKVGVDFLDYLTFEFGMFNEPKRAGSNCSRVFAKIGVHVGLALSNQYVQDIIKGQLGGAFGLKFDNPLQTGWDAIISYMEDQSTKLTPTDLINLFALEYAGYAYGGLEVNFPQILIFGPFHLASVYSHMNFSVKLNIQPEGLGTASAWVAGRARLLEDLRGWFAYNMGNEYLAFGHGDLPDYYANLAGVTTYSMMSMSAASDPANELGEGLRVLADTETSGGAFSPAQDTGAFSLFAAAPPSIAGTKIYSGKEGDIFTRRFTLPNDSADYFLAVRQLEAGTDADLRLYAPNGAEITLNVWGAEDTVNENDARFVYNTLAGRDENGNRTWLIALPEDTNKVGTGEWMLKSSRDVSVQLWQQDAMPGIGGVALSGSTSTNGKVSLNKDTLTIDLENLKPQGSGNGQQNYQYSVDLVRRAAPDGEALTTIQVPLSTTNLGGKDQENNTAAVGDYYGDVGQGSGSDYDSKTLTVTLNASIFPDDATPGDYYPETVLYRYYGTDAEGVEQRMPLDRMPSYEAVKVTNSTFADATVGNLTAKAGQNQSIEVTFDGVSKDDTDYATLKSAGYLITGYTVAAYGADGLPAQAMPAAVSASEGSSAGQPGYVTGGLTLSYDSAQDGSPSLPAGADDSHTAILTGLTPGQYTVGVTPVFASEANIAVQSNGVETRSSGAVEVKAAVTPTLTLNLTGGVIQDGDGKNTILCVSPGFELTVGTAANADINIIRYRDKEEMASVKGAQALTLSAQDYFSKNSATVNGEQVIGGYETLMITAIDSATLGSVNQVVTVVPDLTPPTLIVDNLAGDARVIATTDGNFTVKGRTQPGLTASLLNAAAPTQATADDEGRFSLKGTLPQSSDGQIAVSVMGASGLTASQTLKVEQVGAEDFTALELSPADTLTMTQGDTLALTVLGVKADGGKISLSPSSLTFTATGSVTVDASGTLTVTGTGAGTVAAKLGTLQSNTLRIQAQASGGAPGPSGGPSGTGRPEPVDELKDAAPADSPAVNPFTDISESAWYYDDVMFAYTRGLMVGTTADRFSPGTSMTRGMIVTVLGRLHGIDTSGFTVGTFSDVDAAAYYAAYVEWAREAGIVNGVGGNNFDPDAPITRQDLAVILYNYIRFTDKELPKKREYEMFADDADIAAYASEAVNALYTAGVINGKPANIFDPRGMSTRAEVAAVLHRFFRLQW
ncbi:MAG: S-layer homology domain-containing protein, partial [Oscillospiraceae bacterium]|nr:S-layer homology domain-containing protein [Oscillospiraceae bacterium]